MEKELLKVINEELRKIVKYEYGEYTGPLQYPYAVGEYNDSGFSFENNYTNGEMIITVFHKGKEIDLINIKEEIKKVFSDFRKETDNGTVFVSYRNKLFVRSGEQDLKKMEIYLETKYWEGVN